MPTFLLARLQDIFLTSAMTELLKIIFDCPVYLYSEGFGARIQKGGGNYIKDGVDIAIFDIRIGDWWLKQADVNEIATKLGLKTVPLVGYGTLEELVTKVQAGFNSTYGAFPAEGIVARPAVDLLCRNRQRVITKLKTKDF
jgi:hypothetical protein